MNPSVDPQAAVSRQICDRILSPEGANLLPEQVQKNIETIIGFQDQQKQNASAHDRVLEKVAAAFGQPRFLYLQFALLALWIAYSHLVKQGILSAGFPQFSFGSQGLDVASLMISTGVLIYQTRQEKLSEQQSHLMLQIDLLTEQKIAKLIALVEELRADLPDVKNRHDSEAKAMQQATDPQVIIEILQDNLESTVAIAETASDRIKKIT
ncbi:MAG: DUF1003 domain-containing protein [Aphanocapsa sp. GSE-SYN-MK-11-07L]|jgi:uncharacterized membrane protein|nr:DUF1003 domain-containing protein [Aphanocapsa sp. GSE-SYN-MK-11-07L]